jgi:hypothetical protein
LFGFNGNDGLQYRGRLDAFRMMVPNARRDFFEAMKQVADGANAVDGMLNQVEGSISRNHWAAAA